MRLIKLLGLALTAGFAQAAISISSFDALLDAGSMQFSQPQEFTILEPQANNVFSYEHAIQHKAKKLEVRYAIRPISMIEIDYEDPHNAAPEPNHLFSMLFQTLISDLSSHDGRSPKRDYSQEDAKTKFNADWAAIAAMDVNPKFSSDYKEILLLALHKNNAADAYVMLLYDDYNSVKPEISAVLTSLKFIQK